MKLNLSLRSKILIPTITLLLVTMAITTLVSIVSYGEVVNKAIFSQVKQQAQLTGGLLELWLDNSVQDVQTLSDFEIFRDVSPDSYFGRSALRSAASLLKDTRTSKPRFSNFIITNRTGIIIFSLKDNLIGEDYSDYFPVKSALAGKLSISEPEIDRSSKAAFFTVAIPIKSKFDPLLQEESITNVLLGRIELQEFSRNYLAKDKLGRAAAIFVAEGSGRVIIHSESADLVDSDVRSFAFGEKLLKSNSGFVSYQENKIPKIIVYDSLPSRGWYIAVIVDTDDLLKAAYKAVYIYIGLSAVVLLIALLTMIYVAATISKPLLMLTKATNKISKEKNFSLRIDIDSTDEIGDLAINFNAMAKELQISFRNLERRNELKDEFLSTISHELRTPMNGVEGAFNLLNTTPLSDEQQKYVEIGERSTSDMNSMLETILQFIEIQSNSMIVHHNRFNLVTTIDRLSLRYHELCEKKGLNFSKHILDDVPKIVVGDEQLVCQLLDHILSNAVKFTQRGTVAIEVSRVTHRDKFDKLNLRFRIEDSGIGIPQSHLEEIFEAFTQVDGSSKRRFGGLGIGLALSTQIINLMDGRLSVSSNVGKGTVVYVDVLFTRDDTLLEKIMEEVGVTEKPPALLVPDAQDRQDEPLVYDSVQHDRQAFVPASVESTKQAREKVLIVEDNEVNQAVLKTMVEKLGYEAVVANNGLIGIETYRKSEGDIILILMDCQMPVMDGYEATESIRRMPPPLGEVPIIAVTANLLTSNKERCLACGMSDLVAKPVKLNTVKEKIDYWGKVKFKR